MTQLRYQVSPDPDAIAAGYRALHKERNRRASVVSLNIRDLETLLAHPWFREFWGSSSPDPPRTQTLFGMLLDIRHPDDLPGIAWLEYEDRP
jgi:hypothetical protein